MTALVTGASGEIGGAIARRLAERGYDIIVHYNSSFPEELLRDIGNMGVKAAPFRADLSKPDELKSLADFAVEAGTDILINNAGVSVVGLFQDIDAESEERLFAVNSIAPIRLARLLLPSMLRRHFGAIVNISSIWGVYGAACEVHYSASKAALIGFTKALADELEGSGVMVNCIAPGFVETKMNDHLTDAEKAAFLAETPLGRAVTPDEVAEKALSLVSGNESGKIIIME